jgi:hypothetical protein
VGCAYPYPVCSAVSMSSSSALPDPAASALSPAQIEVLQHLIRQFKGLGKRFSESNVPALIEKYINSASQQGSAVPAAPNHFASKDVSSQINPKPEQPSNATELVQKPPPIKTTSQPLSNQPQATPPQTPAANQPALSWQCYHSLLSVGLAKISTDGSSSLMPSVLFQTFFINSLTIIFNNRTWAAFRKGLIFHWFQQFL